MVKSIAPTKYARLKYQFFMYLLLVFFTSTSWILGVRSFCISNTGVFTPFHQRRKLTPFSRASFMEPVSKLIEKGMIEKVVQSKWKESSKAVSGLKAWTKKMLAKIPQDVLSIMKKVGLVTALPVIYTLVRYAQFREENENMRRYAAAIRLSEVYKADMYIEAVEEVLKEMAEAKKRLLSFRTGIDGDLRWQCDDIIKEGELTVLDLDPTFCIRDYLARRRSNKPTLQEIRDGTSNTPTRSLQDDSLLGGSNNLTIPSQLHTQTPPTVVSKAKHTIPTKKMKSRAGNLFHLLMGELFSSLTGSAKGSSGAHLSSSEARRLVAHLQSKFNSISDDMKKLSVCAKIQQYVEDLPFWLHYFKNSVS